MHRATSFAIAAVLGLAAQSAAQADLAPVLHQQYGAAEDFAVVRTEGSLEDLAVPFDNRYRISSWLESGYPSTIEETFTFTGGPAPQLSATQRVPFRIVALLYMDGDDNIGLAPPVRPPQPGTPGLADSADWRYLEQARFLVEDGIFWFPARHDLLGAPAENPTNLPDIFTTGFPTDRSYMWDTGSVVHPAVFPEGRMWAQPWSPGGNGEHPGLIEAHGEGSALFFTQTAPGQYQVRVRFRTKGYVPSGNRDITHRWDLVQLMVDLGAGLQPWGQVSSYRAVEHVDPRAGLASRFAQSATGIGGVAALHAVDNLCLASIWRNSVGIPNQGGFELWDEFEYDLSPFDIDRSDPLDTLQFRATVYVHGDHETEPIQSIPPRFAPAVAEMETVDETRIEILDWSTLSWVPLPQGWIDTSQYPSGTGTLWRDTPPHAYATSWSRPTGNGVQYTGGIDSQPVRTAWGFPLLPQYLSANAHVRVRVYTRFSEIRDWAAAWDVNFAWDSALLSIGFGQGCNQLPGSEAPRLLSANYAIAGLPFTLYVAGAQAFSPGILIFGLSKSSWSGVPLPTSLAPVGIAGCSLYTSVDMALPYVTDGNGWKILSYPSVPLVRPAVPFYVQALGVSVNPLGFWYASNAYGIRFR